jgi:hypothetical protein
MWISISANYGWIGCSCNFFNFPSPRRTGTSSGIPPSSMTATHQAKRPYAGSHSQIHTQHQSTITSYFPYSSSTFFPSTIWNDTHTNTISSCPALSPFVQSNLLSVGMRVRKSVPEGYKTGLSKKHNSYSGASSSVGVAGYGFSDSTFTGPPSAPFKTPATVKREPMPFCGIIKVGGLA